MFDKPINVTVVTRRLFSATMETDEQITTILKEMPEDAPHHLGYPFLSAYQIAIEFSRCYPQIVAKTSYRIGGAGSGDHNSLSQYLAQRLSTEIKAGRMLHVEGGGISNYI